MGMDSYLYRTTKKEQKAYDDWNKVLPVNEKAFNDFYDFLVKKYPDFEKVKNRESFVELCTEEDVKKYDELNKAIRYKDDDRDEVMYWRKPYALHGYIAKNFLPSTTPSDNCERIYLTKENVEQLIKALRNGEIKDEDEEWYFDDARIAEAVNIFSNLTWDDDTVYYYYAWY